MRFDVTLAPLVASTRHRLPYCLLLALRDAYMRTKTAFYIFLALHAKLWGDKRTFLAARRYWHFTYWRGGRREFKQPALTDIEHAMVWPILAVFNQNMECFD